MPDKKATWRTPFLTDEQAIGVAAFINDDRLHPRPEKRDKSVPDYPDANVKPIDYGTGPYADTFSAMQHKFGPYQPSIDYLTARQLPVIFSRSCHKAMCFLQLCHVLKQAQVLYTCMYT